MAHRAMGLLGLGFTVDQIGLVVHVNDVVHIAEDLRAKGWPHSTIVDELT